MLDDFRQGLFVWGSVGFSWSVEGENQATGHRNGEEPPCPVYDTGFFFGGGKNLIEEIPCPRFICDGMPSTFHICGGHNMVHFQMTFNQVLFKTGM